MAHDDNYLIWCVNRDQNRDLQLQLVGMRVHLSNLIENPSPTSLSPTSVEQLLHDFELSTQKRDDILHSTIRRVEEKMLEITSSRDGLERPIQQAEAAPPPYDFTRRRPSNRPASRRSSQQHLPSVALQIRSRALHCGNGICRCACHSTTRLNTPGGLLNRVVGQLFMGFSGVSILSPSCNIPSCEAAKNPAITAEYWFPMGLFWSMIVQFNLSYQVNAGPQIGIKTLRRVPDSAMCVNYTIKGDIEGLKGLFRRGTASPRDVSDTRGYSLLRVSTCGYRLGRLSPLIGMNEPD